MLSRKLVAENLYESMTTKSCWTRRQHNLMRPVILKIIDEMEKQLGYDTKEYRLCYRRLRQNFKFRNTNVVARLLNGSILPADLPRMKSAEMIPAVKEKINDAKMSCHMERPVGKVIKHNYVVIEPVTNA